MQHEKETIKNKPRMTGTKKKKTIERIDITYLIMRPQIKHRSHFGFA